MKCKRIITAFISAIWLSVSSTVYVSNAAVIEPELVKTETWTTSYYIDDDESTTYPYIDCQADIYSDGTVKFYFWNTHEWDGFATVKHRITLCCSAPVGNDLKEFAFKNKILYDDNGLECFPVSSNATAPFSADYSFWEPIDVSYCPKEYSTTIMGGFFFNNSYYKEYYCCKNGIKYQSFIGFYSTECALSQLPVNQKKSITFTPKVDPLETYKFRLLGHDITVSPDILSSHIVATPQISEQEKYIAELEKKNAELTAEIERLKQNPSSMQDDIMRLDANGDGFVNAVDASIVLAIYANNSTNKTPITKLSEYFNIINGT